MADAPAKPKRVLIVDDDDAVVKVLEHVMKAEGFETEAVFNGAEAKSRLGASRPDLLVLDLMLPGTGGFELIRHLQTTDLARVPVVVMTGRYGDASTEQIIRMESNVKEFFRKPLRYQDLMLKVHALLKTKPPQAP